jgi:rhodanese-related sulfurtransferase
MPGGNLNNQKAQNRNNFFNIRYMAVINHLTTIKDCRNRISFQVFCLIILSILATEGVGGQIATYELPKEKQTIPGLYLTANEAYEKWKADPGNIKILDVRTPEEYIFIGHPAMAFNIPLLIQTMEWDSVKKHFSMKPNPDFISGVKQIAGLSETILVTCRSGGRSAMAVNKLADAGFTNVYSITDGFEGDLVTDPGSVFMGKRMKNGWKNSGLPWTYSIDPLRMFLPEE